MHSTLPEKFDSKIYTIFDSFRNYDINYCHWKSNSHLDKSFESISDFDLLIDSKDTEKFLTLMHDFKFKRKFSSANYVYPGFDDFLGFDEFSGKIYHFHVHYKLIIGKKNQKNFRIPVEKLILDTAISHDKFPIRVILPELEFIFLILRALLKFGLDLKNIKKMIVKRKKFPPNILEEFEYLRKLINKDLFYSYCNNMFSDLLWIFKVLSSKSPQAVPLYWLVAARYRLVKSLRKYRIFGGKQFNTQRRIRILSSRYNMGWLNNGGISIGFIGVDGSGKTTTIDLIKRWLNSKLSVKSFYMGLPKGNLTWEFYRFFFRLFKKLGISFLSEKFNILKNIYSAKIKYKTFLASEMAKNQGNVVLLDRYPLQELWALSDEPTDGPLIKDNAYWQSIERKYYKKIKPADYIFVLMTEHEDAVNRKSEHKSEYKQIAIRQKGREISKLVKSKRNYLIPINNSGNREKVLIEIKRKIWSILN